MASVAHEFPPLDRSLLFPDLINFHMERNPSFPTFVYTNESVPDTLTEISFLEFGRAAHRVAHALRPSRQGPDGEVVMVIANTDTILHHAAVAGLSIAGWVVRLYTSSFWSGSHIQSSHFRHRPGILRRRLLI